MREVILMSDLNNLDQNRQIELGSERERLEKIEDYGYRGPEYTIFRGGWRDPGTQIPKGGWRFV